MLLMGRGIPCLYYGTELGFDTRCEPDGKVRQDMPGGWAEDERSAFEAGGRTDDEQAWFDHVRGLLNLRRQHPAAFQGGMEHFFPKRGVYGFARTDDNVRVVTLVNAASEARPLPWDNLEDWLDGAASVEELQGDGSLKDRGCAVHRAARIVGAQSLGRHAMNAASAWRQGSGTGIVAWVW